jgi:hemerythrin superfamily protein
MAKSINTGNDVVSFLKAQHLQVKDLLEEVATAHGKKRAKAFDTLRRTLAVHEAAEEEIVHPAAKKVLPDGESIVTARLHEEHEAKDALTELESLDVDSEAFASKFAKLKTAVIHHAESEEREEFERLGEVLEPKRLEQMRKAAEFAESVAPTRPHPDVGESRAANLLTGPFAAMVDRTRDAFAEKRNR